MRILGVVRKEKSEIFKTLVLSIALLSSGTLTNTMAEDKGVTLLPLQSGAQLYFGQMFNIEDSLQETSFPSPITIPTTSLWMVQNAMAGERMKFGLGIAGTFWYPYPEDTAQGWTSYRTGGVAISQAVGTYSFGDVTHPWLQVSVGLQGYKYNPYAKNFGEYMFRSDAYPTTLRTGDWGAIDNAGAGIWGVAFKGDFLGGMIKNDFIVNLAERTPLHDISFTDIASLQLGKAFQIGGGVMLSRFIQIDPKKSRPERAETGWISWTAADQQNLRAYLQTKLAADSNFLSGNDNAFPSNGINDNFEGIVGYRTPDSANFILDTSLTPGDYWAESKRPLVAFLINFAKQDSLARKVDLSSRVDYVDSKTIMLMGRASFDPKPLFGWESLFGPFDLVLYSEISVLGLNNYPIYYRKTSERTPIMAGFYLPTFKLLDFLTVEMEYLKNPHINSDFRVAIFRAPRPKSPDGTLPEIPSIADPYHDGFSDPDTYKVNHTEDDLKWTVTALKSFGAWNVAAQAGKDHYRPLTGSFRPTFTEAATTKGAWYYMIRLMVNI